MNASFLFHSDVEELVESMSQNEINAKDGDADELLLYAAKQGNIERKFIKFHKC